MVKLDGKHIAQVIARIAEEDAALGAALSDCAGRLAYTAILDAIDGSATAA